MIANTNNNVARKDSVIDIDLPTSQVALIAETKPQESDSATSSSSETSSSDNLCQNDTFSAANLAEKVKKPDC